MKQATVPVKTETPKRLVFVKSENALASYLNDIRKTKSLSLAEERALALRIQAGDNQAVKALVEGNLKFVVAVCRKFQYQGMSLGDLVNEGNLGLIKAARRFDGSRNFKFISYAVWWIRQGIFNALAEQSRVLSISTAKVGVIHKIGKANSKLSQALGRKPCMGEVADEMRMTERELGECLYLANPPMSLSRPATGEDDGHCEDHLPDVDSAGTDESARRWVVAKHTHRLLEPLLEREGEVLRLFFGIGAQHALSMGEIAGRFALTRERVRQIKETALRKLRLPSRARQFDALRN